VFPDSKRWHLITGEYSPTVGGVAAFSREIGDGLADAGRDVHVWCPAPAAAAPPSKVTIHGVAGGWTREGMHEVDRALERFTSPRRLFVPQAVRLPRPRVPWQAYGAARQEKSLTMLDASV
jgi:hypothetical protein